MIGIATKKKKEKEQKPRIGFATHAHWVIDFDVHFNHLRILPEMMKKHDIVLLGYKGLMAAQARELICDNAVEEKCSHVFFLDADHIVPEESLDFLMESKDEAMVSGLICRRWYPFAQVAYGKNDKTGAYVEIHIDLAGDIVEVGACAFGCTVINIEKLKQLQKPWFRDTCTVKFDGKPANIRSDINLCDAFRARGEKIWIDTRVLVGHTAKELVVYPQNADMLKNFHHQYTESFKLKHGEHGKYAPPGRAL
jgi:hypothetical protein